MRNFSYIPKYKYEEYSQWEGKWELIDGSPYAMVPLPSVKHQRISQKIAFQLEFLLKGCKSCTALLPVDWKINEDTVLQPDNMVICFPLPDENFITQTPAVIFEILSPATATKDKMLKYEIYQEKGVKYYIIVEPKTNFAEVFEYIGGSYTKKITANNQKVKFKLYECDIEFNFADIWI